MYLVLIGRPIQERSQGFLTGGGAKPKFTDRKKIADRKLKNKIKNCAENTQNTTIKEENNAGAIF